MAAIAFPTSPVTGQTFSSANSTWRWDGAAWRVVRDTNIAPVLPFSAIDFKGAVLTDPAFVSTGIMSGVGNVTVDGAQALTNKTYNGVSLAAGAAGKTLTVNNTLSLSGSDGSTLDVSTSGAVGTFSLVNNATGFSVAGGTASKTLTVNNTIALSGTDGSTLNIGTGGTLGTFALLDAATTSTALTAATNITTTAASLLSLSLTAGTWLVVAHITMAGTNSGTQVVFSINSASSGSGTSYASEALAGSGFAGADNSTSLSGLVTVGTTTTIYLVGDASASLAARTVTPINSWAKATQMTAVRIA